VYLLSARNFISSDVGGGPEVWRFYERTLERVGKTYGLGNSLDTTKVAESLMTRIVHAKTKNK
jgi:hypothetical protein